jgi:hypothetical protein
MNSDFQKYKREICYMTEVKMDTNGGYLMGATELVEFQDKSIEKSGPDDEDNKTDTQWFVTGNIKAMLKYLKYKIEVPESATDQSTMKIFILKKTAWRDNSPELLCPMPMYPVLDTKIASSKTAHPGLSLAIRTAQKIYWECGSEEDIDKYITIQFKNNKETPTVKLSTSKIVKFFTPEPSKGSTFSKDREIKVKVPDHEQFIPIEVGKIINESEVAHLWSC